MARIVKIVYDDDTELAIDVKPLIISDDLKQQAYNRISYQRQFNRFEIEILEVLNQDTVEEYAKDSFDLVEETACKTKEISEFDDDEIKNEAMDRGLLEPIISILEEDLLLRFSKIIKSKNYTIIDDWLSSFETKTIK